MPLPAATEPTSTTTDAIDTKAGTAYDSTASGTPMRSPCWKMRHGATIPRRSFRGSRHWPGPLGGQYVLPNRRRSRVARTPAVTSSMNAAQVDPRGIGSFELRRGHPQAGDGRVPADAFEDGGEDLAGCVLHLRQAGKAEARHVAWRPVDGEQPGVHDVGSGSGWRDRKGSAVCHGSPARCGHIRPPGRTAGSPRAAAAGRATLRSQVRANCRSAAVRETKREPAIDHRVLQPGALARLLPAGAGSACVNSSQASRPSSPGKR